MVHPLLGNVSKRAGKLAAKLFVDFSETDVSFVTVMDKAPTSVPGLVGGGRTSDRSNALLSVGDPLLAVVRNCSHSRGTQR
eukprot:3275475-Amphidinium_carterae.1